MRLCGLALDEIAGDAGPALASVLDSREAAQAERFLHDADRDAYVAAHALLRHALSQAADVPPQAWRFEADAAGKPHLAPAHAWTGLAFSLSHTRGAVLVGIARRMELGVDVERVDPGRRFMEIAEAYFHPLELADLRAARGEAEACRRFTAIWTVKEAFLKALGTGLAQPLHSFACDRRADGQLRFRDPALGPPDRWRVYTWAEGDMRCAGVAGAAAHAGLRVVHDRMQYDRRAGWSVSSRHRTCLPGPPSAPGSPAGSL